MKISYSVGPSGGGHEDAWLALLSTEVGTEFIDCFFCLDLGYSLSDKFFWGLAHGFD